MEILTFGILPAEPSSRSPIVDGAMEAVILQAFKHIGAVGGTNTVPRFAFSGRTNVRTNQNRCRWYPKVGDDRHRQRQRCGPRETVRPLPSGMLNIRCSGWGFTKFQVFCFSISYSNGSVGIS